MKRSDIYKAIRDKLLVDIEGITVDVQRGQMGAENYPMLLPLALVDISNIKWETVSARLQRGEVEVKVDYFKILCSGTFSGAEAEDESLTLIDSPDDISLALNAFELPFAASGQMFRTGEKALAANGRLVGYRIEFVAEVYEQLTIDN
jgi:hypothetical protein